MPDLLDPRLMTLSPTTAQKTTLTRRTPTTTSMYTVADALKDTATEESAAPVTSSLITKEAPTFSRVLDLTSIIPSAQPTPEVMATPQPSATLAKPQSTLSAYQEEKLLTAVATGPAPAETAESAESETWWNLRRLPAQTQTEDVAISDLTAEAKAQDPISILRSTPRVATNPEIVDQGLIRETTSNVADAYGAGTILELKATRSAEMAPRLLTTVDAIKQQQGMDHESLIQESARKISQEMTTLKPLIPPATAPTTEQVMKTFVTTKAADRSSTQELQQGQVGVRHMQTALDTGSFPGMPLTPEDKVPVTPDMPSLQEYPSYRPQVAAPDTTMAKIKKYGPYAAAGVIAILLLRR